MKFSGNVENGKNYKWFNFVGDPEIWANAHEMHS